MTIDRIVSRYPVSIETTLQPQKNEIRQEQQQQTEDTDVGQADLYDLDLNIYGSESKLSLGQQVGDTEQTACGGTGTYGDSCNGSCGTCTCGTTYNCN